MVQLGGIVGGLIRKGKEELEERLRPKAPDVKKSFEEAHGPIWSDRPNEGNPEYVVSSTTPGAKLKGGKTGPATTNYYRVDMDDNGKFSARKLEKAEVNASVAQSAKTTAQLQAELVTANSPASLTEAIGRASRADELVGKAKNPKYDRPEAADNRLSALAQSNPAQARDAIIQDMERTETTLGKLKDKQMDPAMRQSIGDAVGQDIGKLQRAQDIPEVLGAVQQAVNPAAPAPKVDPLAAPKADPLAPK